MLNQLPQIWRKTKRLFSRPLWVLRMLRMPAIQKHDGDPGVVMIQIDGLSETQFRQAMEKGRLPFLKRQLRKERHRLLPLYSGVPSTTPAVQGELFYGVRQVVPSFSFLDTRTGRQHVMYKPDSASEIGKWLEQAGSRPLLQGGSSFSNVYAAGAEHARFCAQTMSLPGLPGLTRPLNVVFTLLVHLEKVILISGLGIAELFLALTDAVRGVACRYSLTKELRFIPARVGIGIVLREIIRFLVKVDIMRGQRIIHANFLGYDEQAHRRGPDSAFAHWSLKGIDKAIRDIARTANNSDLRDYSVAIFSDHGQQRVRSFQEIHGKTIASAVNESLSSFLDMPDSQTSRQGAEANSATGSLYPTTTQQNRTSASHVNTLNERNRYILRMKTPRQPDRRNAKQQTASSKGNSEVPRSNTLPSQALIKVVAMGPVGHIYWPFPINDDSQKASIAQALFADLGIPTTLYRDSEGRTQTHNAKGQFCLPANADEVLGAGHPFLHEAAEDLHRLAGHADSGDFIISGWSPYADQPISFPLEHGAHAGPGPAETNGFLLLPDSMSYPESGNAPMRPEGLREIVLRHLEQSQRETRPHKAYPNPSFSSSDHKATPSTCHASSNHQLSSNDRIHSSDKYLRVITYNIHSCRGTDGRLRHGRIARVIEQSGADLAALQEVDFQRVSSGSIDQAAGIASILGFHYTNFPVCRKRDGQFGLAIISRYPLHDIESRRFNSPPGIHREKRGVLLATARTPLGDVRLLNTHFGLSRRERLGQSKELLELISHWPTYAGGQTPSTTHSVMTKERIQSTAPMVNQSAYVRESQSDFEITEARPTSYLELPPVILCGDFNASPASPVVHNLSRCFMPANNIDRTRRAHTFTYHSRKPFRQIDHIFASHGIAFLDIYAIKTSAAKTASDHLPLCADFKLK